jgi:hypothetical protein
MCYEDSFADRQTAHRQGVFFPDGEDISLNDNYEEQTLPF